MLSPDQLQKEVAKLEEIISRLPNDSSAWFQVADIARTLADSLKSTDSEVDERTILGQTNLPRLLASVVKQSRQTSCNPPQDAALPALYQTLRVSANICADHDQNRASLLAVGMPEAIVQLLQSYIPDTSSYEILPLDIPHLLVIRTAIGVLINASYASKTVRSHLLSVKAPSVIFRLCCTIYKPRSWSLTAGTWSDQEEEEWRIRCGIASWTWQVLTEFRDREQEERRKIFTEKDLDLFTSLLPCFVPSAISTSVKPPSDMRLKEQLIAMDLEVLEESTMFIETLALDLEAARIQMASDTILRRLVQFIEHGTYPTEWDTCKETEIHLRQKNFDLCKGALVTVLTTIAGEDRNAGTLWDGNSSGSTDQSNTVPNSWFATTMLEWIKTHSPRVQSSKGAREDLVIAGTLCLGNLARRDSRSMQLAKSPTDVVPFIKMLLGKGIDIKVKNGSLGLLKTLSQPQANRDLLGEAGIPEALAESGIWDTECDMAEVVQGFAIGTIKHLCHANAKNACKVATSQSDTATCLQQILDLVKRSDTVAIKSEGTRVLVNVIKSLCPNQTSQSKNELMTKAIEFSCRPQQSIFLAQLLGRSQKYPVLLNESIVSMTLVALQPDGLSGVLSALFAPLREDSSLNSMITTGSQSSMSSPTGHPQSALDVINSILASSGNKFPAELRTNACSLVTALYRDCTTQSEEMARQRGLVKESVQQTLKSIVSDGDSLTESERALQEAAKRALSVM